MKTIKLPPERRRLKVLHVASMLYSGGVERWLTDLCARARAFDMDMDIAVLYRTESLFADVARREKIPVHYCPGGGANPLPFIGNLRALIRQHGPYDAIHSHIHLYSAFALIAGYLENTPVRIAHSHNVVGNEKGGFQRIAYLSVARMLLGFFSTHKMAPASRALEDMVGPGYRTDSSCSLMPCGISLAPFERPIPDSARRHALGLSADDFVIATVGRLTEEKNSEFMVEILGKLLHHQPKARLLMIGEGPLKEKLRARAQAGQYEDRLILAGLRSDVPDLLRGVADLFLFPSPPPPLGNEALPIAVVEAQACGLPVVISDGITREAIVVESQVLQLLASDTAESWAQAILQFAMSHKPDIAAARPVLASSQFNIEQNLRYLREIYEFGQQHSKPMLISKSPL